MNRIACADFTFPLLPHDAVFQLISLLDCEGVDLGLFRGRSHLGPDDLRKDAGKIGRTMARRVAAHGLAVADVFLQSGAEPHFAAANDPELSVRERNRDDFLMALEFAVAAGSAHLTGLPGVIQTGLDNTSCFELAAEVASWRLETAASAGIAYAVEPHVGSLCPDIQTTHRLLDLVPGLTVTLDYGHFIYQGMPSAEVHSLIPRASHFHARGGAPGMLQSTIADNKIDFPEILSRFKKSGYAGWICLEYVWVDWEGCNRTDNLSESILLRDLLGRSHATTRSE